MPTNRGRVNKAQMVRKLNTITACLAVSGAVGTGVVVATAPPRGVPATSIPADTTQPAAAATTSPIGVTATAAALVPAPAAVTTATSDPVATSGGS